MAGTRGEQEGERAKALGALIRQRRRHAGMTLGVLAPRVPMSTSNLSRLENGEQGPPADEAIVRIAAALDSAPDEFLQAAGRPLQGESFEETVLARLDAISDDLDDIKGALKLKRPT